MGLLRLLCPNRRLDSVLDIPPEWMVAHKFRGVILDLDNTLVPWNTSDLKPEIIEWVKRLRASGLEVCIVSNSGGRQRVEEIAARLGIQCVTLAAKPSRRAFRLALEGMGTTPEETVAVGDQMFTDVLGGNRIGCITILVRPIIKNDFALTRIVRVVEAIMLKVLQKKSMIVTRLDG